MNWTRFIGALSVLVIAVSVIGALFTLATRLLTGQYVVPSVVVLLLVAVSVAVSVRLAVLSSRFLSNPYW